MEVSEKRCRSRPRAQSVILLLPRVAVYAVEDLETKWPPTDRLCVPYHAVML